MDENNSFTGCNIKIFYNSFSENRMRYNLMVHQKNIFECIKATRRMKEERGKRTMNGERKSNEKKKCKKMPTHKRDLTMNFILSQSLSLLLALLRTLYFSSPKFTSFPQHFHIPFDCAPSTTAHCVCECVCVYSTVGTTPAMHWCCIRCREIYFNPLQIG